MLIHFVRSTGACGLCSVRLAARLLGNRDYREVSRFNVSSCVEGAEMLADLARNQLRHVPPHLLKIRRLSHETTAIAFEGQYQILLRFVRSGWRPVACLLRKQG
jgi:hypothetical protein